MATREVVVDAPRAPLDPIDESVIVPKAVRDAAARAEQFYHQPPADAPPANDNNEPPANDNQPPAAAALPARADAQPPVDAPPAPAADAPPPQPQPPVHDNVNWEQRYLSMKGRYDQSQQTIGSMQEQMQEMGTELVRLQALLQNGLPAPGGASPLPAGQRLLTAEDEQTYGGELLDVVRRAATEAISPQMTKLEKDNAQLKQTLERNQRAGVHSYLDMEIPDWRTVNLNPRFKQWLSLRDVYSGVVKMRLLGEAFRAADAPRVARFFKDFIADEVATGQASPSPQNEPPASPPAPRTPATTLEALAAPGRARPAPGGTMVPAEKPVFTRAYISGFYTDVRRGAYAGRDTEKNALEQQIFAAQREGRIRG